MPSAWPSVVFDLDGTLVDTRQAVTQAYRWAGVELPDHAWGRPWQEWLPQLLKYEDNAEDPLAQSAEQVHKLKNHYYQYTLKLYARALPCLERATHRSLVVLTGASRDAVTTLLKWNRSEKFAVIYSDLRLDDKIDWLNARPPGVYVDDDARVRERLVVATDWHVLSPEFYLELQGSARVRQK